MWFSRVQGRLVGGGGGSSIATIGGAFVRYFSKKRAVNLRKINPKVPHQQAYSIAEDLYGIVKQHGPLNNANAWNLVKDAGIVESKTHMKIMFKWMRGRKMLKLLCNRVGSNKKFLHCTLPEEPQSNEPESQPEEKVQPKKPSKKDSMQGHKRLL